MGKKPLQQLIMQQLMFDDTPGWIALIVGMTILLYVFRPRQGQGGNDRRQVTRGPNQANRTQKPTSFDGWTMLICLDTLRDPTNPSLAFTDENKALLQNVAKTCDLHVVRLVNNEAEEKETLEILRQCGALEAGLKEHCVLFCETIVGKQAIARQLNPSIYIEGIQDIVSYISPHVPHVGFITDSSPTCSIRPNTIVSATVSEYLTRLIA
eukprot:TRINITY_DN114_c1_g2_i1.p1 TRINITY_DN114_c1_g2~~TRINITY_DN114_c1_g2_i1.p1  ORF type:complete len:225 (+),score=26.04 TRINITY_DN114_c1_g2_i1:47-676(+)